MKYATHILPNFVKDWLGGYRDIEMHRLDRKVWLISGPRRSVIVRARCAIDARIAARDFISIISPRTDQRRVHWFYT